MKIPKSLHRFFWDVDVKKLDVNKYPYFVVSRLLDKGDIEAARWIKKNFNNDLVQKTLENHRDFSLKSASFWALIYKVPLTKVKCFHQPYLAMRKTHWPY